MTATHANITSGTWRFVCYEVAFQEIREEKAKLGTTKALFNMLLKLGEYKKAGFDKNWDYFRRVRELEKR